MTYTASAQCIKKLCSLEGFRSHPYQDGGGAWAVGFGQTCQQHDYPDGITEGDAMEFVITRTDAICKQLEQTLPNLLDHQIDALTIFLYNIGVPKFLTSHVCLNLMRRQMAAFGFWAQWTKDAKGKVEEGLIRRRDFEIRLFVFGWLA